MLFKTQSSQSGYESSRLASSKDDWPNLKGSRQNCGGQNKTSYEPRYITNSKNSPTNHWRRRRYKTPFRLPENFGKKKLARIGIR